MDKTKCLILMNASVDIMNKAMANNDRREVKEQKKLQIILKTIMEQKKHYE